MNNIAMELLQKAAETQMDRGKEYEKDQDEERSFQKMATAFNAITGRDLSPEEVCLMMVILKNVRQFSDPTRVHYDSLLDAVSYQALLGEEAINNIKNTVSYTATSRIQDKPTGHGGITTA